MTEPKEQRAGGDREVVCCPHCGWSAIRAGRASHLAPDWASRQLGAHLRSRHPERGEPR